MRDIEDFGYRDKPKGRQYQALVKVDVASRAKLMGKQRIWVPMKALSRKSAYLHNCCLDGIWQRVKDPKYKRRLVTISVGSKKKQTATR